jgi:hypothetical protein
MKLPSTVAASGVSRTKSGRFFKRTSKAVNKHRKRTSNAVNKHRKRTSNAVNKYNSDSWSLETKCQI